ISLKDSFNRADVTAILPWHENLYEQVVAEAILEMIDNAVPAEQVKAAHPSINAHTVNYLLEKAKKQDITKLDEFSKLIRIYTYLWKITDEREYIMQCFATIREATLTGALSFVKHDSSYKLVKD